MTKESMEVRLSALTGETDSEILLAFLDLAAEKILERCYPFQPDNTEVPARYHSIQVEIAEYLLNKRGAQGEISHSENGISRTYESASVPDSMLAGIVPFASTFSTAGS